MLSGHALDDEIDDELLEDIELLELTDDSLETSDALLAISEETFGKELLMQSQQIELELETTDTADCKELFEVDEELLNFSGVNGTLLIVLISLFADDFVGFTDDDFTGAIDATELAG